MTQTARLALSIPASDHQACGTDSNCPCAGRVHPGFTRTRWLALWLGLTVLVLVLGGVTFSSLQEYRARERDAKQGTLQIARAIEPYVERVIERGGNYLERHRALVEAAGGPARASPQRLDEILLNRPLDDVVLRYIVISDAEGRVVWASGPGAGKLANVRDRQFFQTHAMSASRRWRVDIPFRSRIDGGWRMPVSVRLDHPDGSFAGVMNTSVELEQLAKYFASLGLGPEAVIHLMAKSGESLVRHPRPESPIEVGTMSGFTAQISGHEGTFRGLSPVTGADHVGSYRRLSDMPLYAIVAYRADAVFAPWLRNSMERVVAGLGGLAVTAFLLLLLLKRLEAESAAVANLSKFRRAVDLSGDYIYWVDFDGKIAYMNEAAARRLGVDPGRLPANLHIRDVSTHHSDDRWADMREQLIHQGEATFLSLHRSGDGASYPVQVSATHLVVEGQHLGFLISRDLSDQVRQKRAIEEMNASLEQRVAERTTELANANAELESFAYSVSHDLRAPLNHLSAYAEMLVEAAAADVAERERLSAKIRERSDYMNDLIDALLCLSRVGRAQMERSDVDLGEIAAQVDAGCRRLAPGRNVLTHIQAPMRANADPVLLRTLLENLVGNAWKYTSKAEGARIDVFMEEQADGARAFVVRDNGAGFDPRYAERLFGPFVRLHSQSEFTGTGVGLATAKRIVSRHGGRIWAEATLGEGATFRFTLG